MPDQSLKTRLFDWVVDQITPSSRGSWVFAIIVMQLIVNTAAFVGTMLFFPDPQSIILHIQAMGLAIGVPYLIFLMSVIARLGSTKRRMSELAATDFLTGLLNRRAFFDHVAPNGRVGSDGILFLADADHFKSLNDTYGHDAGDRFLCVMSDRLTKLAGGDGVVARFGGEEFVLFVADPPIEITQALRDAARAGFEVALPDGDDEVRITISIGAVPVETGASISRVLRTADEALYVAKNSGRAQLVMADDAEVQVARAVVG